MPKKGKEKSTKALIKELQSEINKKNATFVSKIKQEVESIHNERRKELTSFFHKKERAMKACHEKKMEEISQIIQEKENTLREIRCMVSKIVEKCETQEKDATACLKKVKQIREELMDEFDRVLKTNREAKDNCERRADFHKSEVDSKVRKYKKSRSDARVINGILTSISDVL